MTRLSLINKNHLRIEICQKYKDKRTILKKQLRNRTLSFKEQSLIYIKLTNFPKDSCKTRIRNRCFITGRARGYYRKFNLSRIKLRELGNLGLLPGVVKSSW